MEEEYTEYSTDVKMMSKKQWLLVLCLFVIYLLLGAAIFLTIEMAEEEKRNVHEKAKRQKIEHLLRDHYEGDTQQVRDIFSNLTEYCGKPINYNMSNDVPAPRWDYYHSLFFVITVVSTIGYGNLAPTTATTRIFMILYGLIGIPMNGIVMVTLGEYFGKSFKKLYVRWKNARIKRSAAKLGLIGQIVLYAVPGLTFFIFLPSTIISVFEQWDYDVALYYSFVTLTTIGFGDYVAGDFEDISRFSPMVRYFYQIFLLVWIIGGLGYVVMVIGFITQGMRSRKLVQIEKMLADNIRKTPQRIRNELRSLLHELLFMRVKPVYKGEFEYIPNLLEHSQSCPELRLLGLDNHPKESPNSARKRAMSECYPLATMILTPTTAVKMQSETELEKIDKERTFKPSDAFMQQKDLILKVVDALSVQRFNDGGINCFSDQEILSSENFAPRGRRRAASDSLPSTPMPLMYSKPEGGYTWYGGDATKASLEFSKQRRARAFSVAATKLEGPSLLKRIKNRFNIRNKDEKQPASIDIEKQNLESQYFKIPTSRTPDSTKGAIGPTSLPTDPSAMLTDRVLEQTSIADFIRALSAIAVPEDATAYLREQQPKRKIGVARVGLMPSRADPSIRRPSMAPPPPSALRQAARRRCSLMPVEEHLLSSHEHIKGRLGLAPTSSARSSFKAVAHARRRFSVRPAALPTLASASTIDSTAPSSMPMMSTVPPTALDSTSAPSSMKGLFYSSTNVLPTIISSSANTSSPKVSSVKSVSIVAPNDIPYGDNPISEGVVSSTSAKAGRIDIPIDISLPNVIKTDEIKSSLEAYHSDLLGVSSSTASIVSTSSSKSVSVLTPATVPSVSLQPTAKEETPKGPPAYPPPPPPLRPKKSHQQQ